MFRPARRLLALAAVTAVAASTAAPASTVRATEPTTIESVAVEPDRIGEPRHIDLRDLVPIDASAVPSPGVGSTVGRPVPATPSDTAAGTAPTPAPASWASDTMLEEAERFPGEATINELTGVPDPIVAVGPEHVVQSVGGSLRIMTRAGGHIATYDLTTMFGIVQDPYGSWVTGIRVTYDQGQARWVLAMTWFTCRPTSTADHGTGWVDLAVSAGPDALGPYAITGLRFDDVVPTWPGLGTSTDKVVVSSDLVSILPDCTADLSDHRVAEIDVYDWAGLVSGAVDGVDAFEVLSTDDRVAYALRPAIQSPVSTNHVHLFGLGMGPFGADVIVHAVIDGTPNTVSPTHMTVHNLSSILSGAVMPGGIRQPGVGGEQPFSDHRPLSVSWSAGRLAALSGYPCDPPGGVLEVRTCLRVVELTTSEPPWDVTRRQDVLMGIDGADLHSAGLTYARDGSLHVVWSRSSASPGDFISTYASVQRRSDPVGSFSKPLLLHQGEGTYAGPEWGDLNGLGADPQAVGSIWQGSQIPTADGGWSTEISQIQDEGATYVPIAPYRVLDSRTEYNVEDLFRSGHPQTFPVTGSGRPIPSAAIAITGNLTVTGHTAGGYVSLAPTLSLAPRSSTINVRAGDTRANNVTVPLAGNGRLAAMFMSGAGKTAHLILDVTGYFLPGTEDAGYATMAPTRVLDSRQGIGIGLSGRFASGVPRKLDVAGVKGVPGDAVAVTANLTVIDPSRGGYVSVTPTNQPTPGSSTINVPAGDVRANGLTAKLQGGDLWLVYKSSAGATTDLVLDITGYYRPAGAGLAFHALDPGRIMDTRSTTLTGLSGTFKSGTPRMLETAGHWGVPVGAKAITGNLTVVGQTAGGYVSATPTAQAEPATSTINVPLGDVRANGLTVPLNADGDQAFVFKSASGKTTHLILDVTGYFR